jgi:two-component system NtrC family sensor kinase
MKTPASAKGPGTGPPALRFRIRFRLVLLSVGLLILVSFGFTALTLGISRQWNEENLKERAVAFAREIAATIGDRRELESTGLLDGQIRQIRTVRPNVLQLDILVFGDTETTVVATSHPTSRLPFARTETDRTRQGHVVQRLVTDREGRYWEVLAPITLQDAVAGAVAAKFSLERADRLAARIRRASFAMTAGSIVLMALLMSATIALVVDRPISRFMDAIRRLREGQRPVAVEVRTADEFGVLAHHFNEMVARSTRFNEELRARVAEATAELEGRYREVERLSTQLFEVQRKLGHAERLAIPGRIIAEVAHEIGTPLHSVAGHLELLRNDLPASLVGADLARRLTIIETELRRVTEIIAQLLDLTRREAEPPEPVDLNGVVQDTVDLMRPVTAAGLTVDVTLDPALPKVRGHGATLQQVILNLLTNAMDATPPGGRVAVSTRRRVATKEIEVEVSDNGRGISAVEQERVFEPFFSTKGGGARRGMGLGLYISAQIVRDHRGRIEVESVEGKGSAFRVVLPAPETIP